MKTRILITCIVFFSLVILVPHAFAEKEILILVENKIWKVYYTGEHYSSRSDAVYKSAWTDSIILDIDLDQTTSSPCFNENANHYRPCSPEESKEFYEYKGEAWMEEKKQELINAFNSNAFHEWIDLTKEDHSHFNVYQYYSFYENVERYFTHSSPYHQLNTGTAPQNVTCNYDLVLILKHDGLPACVKSETKAKLIERGWALPTIWKKYITISAAIIDISSLDNLSPIYKLDNLKHDSILYQSLVGADGCKSETDVCALSRGISIDRKYPFGISLSEHDTYSITLNAKQANELLSYIDWIIDERWIYTVVQWNERYYLLMLSTFDNTKTPDVKMEVVDSLPHPVSLERGKILNYTVEVETWATYGSSAQIVLEAVHNAKDSGLNVWMEPDTLIIPERSSATSTLFIQAKENANNGIYDVRVIGRANGNLAGLYCSNTICPVVNIGNSDWSIRTFGSSSGMGIGGGNLTENAWVEIELNKKELFEGDVAEIKAFVINNGTEPIVVNNPRELLIKVIRADSKGYYDHFYGIHARYESDKPIVLEPDSKTLLVRPFYWNQTTYHDDFEAEQRIEPSRRMITMVFAAGNYTWNSELWFEIK